MKSPDKLVRACCIALSTLAFSGLTAAIESSAPPAISSVPPEEKTTASTQMPQKTTASGYMARQEGIKGVFDALSASMNKPVIVSKMAAARKISGDFDLTNPKDTLLDIATQLSLIWYDDGQTLYVYDAAETRNAVVLLRNTTFTAVSRFLRQSGLYDPRYPLRSDHKSSTFYVSGPPIYVETITNTARFLDEKNEGYTGSENIAVIALHNSFVSDRHYKYRNEEIVIPGVSTVINALLSSSGKAGELLESTPDLPALPPYPDLKSLDNQGLSAAPKNVRSRLAQNGTQVIANPGNNSLLVRGSAEQISYIRNIVRTLDQPKRHIELSVWIVDLQKDALDQLGIQWDGQINANDNFGMSLNGGSSTIDGASFMAAALALSEKNKANIVSRPMILTQENIPAIFDNSRTFYTRLIGERTAELENVTYGTLVSVLPRFTESNEIEMMLNVEDGNQFNVQREQVDSLPEVGRTNISTIARVPKGKSLLIGGYTRDENANAQGKIPWLGDLPLIGGAFRYSKARTSNMVRVFLIQPREIDTPLAPDAHQLVDEIKQDLSSDQLQDWMSNYLDSQMRR